MAVGAEREGERQCLVTGPTGCVRGPGILFQQVFMEYLAYWVLGTIPGARDTGQDRTDIVSTLRRPIS